MITNRIPRRLQRPELITIVLVVGIIVLMELIAATGVSKLLLRRPSIVADELVKIIQTDALQRDVVATAYRVFATFVICIVLTAICSIAFWQIDTLRKAFIPMFGAMFGTPLVLGYMVLVAIFGRSDVTIILISTHAVIPMIINSTDALASVDDIYIDIAHSFNANRYEMMRKVIVPAAAPDIFAGIRIGFSYIMISVTAIEFLLTANKGLGGRISNLYLRFRTAEMFASLTFIVLLVILSIFLLRRLEAVIRR